MPHKAFIAVRGKTMATVTIELDQTTVAILQAKAATQGVSLDALLRHLAANGTIAKEETSAPTSLAQFMTDMESLSEIFPQRRSPTAAKTSTLTTIDWPAFQNGFPHSFPPPRRLRAYLPQQPARISRSGTARSRSAVPCHRASDSGLELRFECCWQPI